MTGAGQRRRLAAAVAGLVLVAGATTGHADTAAAQGLAQALSQLEAQEAAIAAQQKQLERQRQELDSLRRQLVERYGLEAGARSADQIAESAEPAAGSRAAASVAAAESRSAEGEEIERGLELSGYGIVSYFNRDWETDPLASDGVDVERFILELEYRFNPQWYAKAELEYEHGGTGSTLELDSQEEFGEFEQSLEAGGEILVEELYVGYNHSDWLNARLGHFVVPVGRTNKFHKPQDYFTVARSAGDAALIPQLWHESGVSLFGTWSLGRWGSLAYEGQVVNGLDSTGFSSRNWIAGGHQVRFEEARAEDFALVARLDYYLNDSFRIGGSWYGGDTTGNRPKEDLQEDAYVDILQVDADWSPGDFILRGQYLWGRLQNSHLVSEANRSLSNKLGVKRTPVGSEAEAWFVEAGYDLMPLFGLSNQSLTLFARYDDYDSMAAAEGLVSRNPRWHRQTYTLGLNYQPLPSVIFKAEYSQRELSDIDIDNRDDTIALGVGFTY